LPYPGILFRGVRGGGMVQQIQLRTEDRDLGAVAPYPLVKVLEAAVVWYKKLHFI